MLIVGTLTTALPVLDDVTTTANYDETTEVDNHDQIGVKMSNLPLLEERNVTASNTSAPSISEDLEAPKLPEFRINIEEADVTIGPEVTSTSVPISTEPPERPKEARILNQNFGEIIKSQQQLPLQQPPNEFQRFVPLRQDLDFEIIPSLSYHYVLSDESLVNVLD